MKRRRTNTHYGDGSSLPVGDGRAAEFSLLTRLKRLDQVGLDDQVVFKLGGTRHRVVREQNGPYGMTDLG